MSATQTSTTAPIVKIAAGAVIIFAAVGVAAMTGLIPGVASKEKPAEVSNAIETPAAQTPAPQTQPAYTTPTAPAAKPRRQIAKAPPVCPDCGVVQSVRAIEVKGEASGAGAVVGGIAGLVVGNQIGDGRGKKLAKVAGAVGGAVAGHQIEKNMKRTAHYEITIRMDDGNYRTMVREADEGFVAGDRVRVLGDSLVPDAS